MSSKPGRLFSSLLLVTSLAGAEQLIPAGSLIQCTISEPNLSSKTTAVGDPVLCQASPVEKFGRSVLPYGTYLVGSFADYKDPGHFIGKGWMELKFERLVVPQGEVIPVAAKVVHVPGYAIDREGRILGKGHAVRDIVEWSIPILWPIDLLTLPIPGPRPKLKSETRLTLKVMDDVVVPDRQGRTPMTMSSAPRDPYGFSDRAYLPPTAPPISYPAPQVRPYEPSYYQAAPPVSAPWQQVGTAQLTVLMLRDGNGRIAKDYWFEGGIQVRYVGLNGPPVVIPMEVLDLQATVEVNRRRGVQFFVRAVTGSPSGY